MKKIIHPNCGPVTASCACGNKMELYSTQKDIHVETCSQCHPFYTGKKRQVVMEGRVERFLRRYQLNHS